MRFLALLLASHVFAGHGLSVTAPVSWHVVGHRLTVCTDPAQRLAVAGPRGQLVVVLERLANPARRGPRRPRPFKLEARPQFIECCAPRRTRGWFFAWVERGRELYAYAYTGGGSRGDVARVLDSLAVAARR